MTPTRDDRSKKTKRVARLLAGILVSAVAIAWLASSVDMGGLRVALSALSWPYIPLLIALYLAGFLLRGVRWKLMLRPIITIRWSLSTALVIVGYMANNILPARLGEVVRALGLTRTRGVNVVTSFASIAVERVFDGLTLMAIFALTTALAPQVDPLLARTGLYAGLLFLSALLGILLVRVFPATTHRAVTWVASFMPTWIASRLLDLERQVNDAVAFLDLDWRMGLILLTSLAIWATEGLVYWAGLSALGLNASPHLAYFTLAVTGVGAMLPSAPGYVGVIQACAVLSFTAFGLPTEQALAYSLVLHAVQYFPITAIGLVLAFRMGLSLNPGSRRAQPLSRADPAQEGTPRCDAAPTAGDA